MNRFCAPEHIIQKSNSSIFLDFDFFWKTVLDINDITYYILPIDCLLIAYRLPLMPICSAIMDMGPGPGPGPAAFGPWVRGPGPISIMAEHMGVKGNR